MRRNYSLDFFRGVMAFCVAIGHYFYWNGNVSIPLSFILAVDYFFILSGFVLAFSILNKKEFNCFSFTKARFLRLYPVYIFSILLTFIVLKLLHHHLGKPDFGDIVRILIIGELLPFVQSSSFIFFEPLGVSWSISAELWVGVIFFPVLHFFDKKANQLVFPFLMLIILICFFIINNYSTDYMNIHYHKFGKLMPFGLIRALLGYALGAFIYIIVKSMQNNSTKKSENIISVIQIIIVFFIIYFYAKNDYIKNNEYYSIFLFSLMIISLSFNKGIIFKLTNNIIGNWFGKISYPLYLLHPVGIVINKEIIFSNIFSIPALLFYIIFISIISILTHIFVENKFLLYFKSKSI
ncbi:acyltransferase family protein [Gilliamella mensalis]|uniref:acyltransferase family protein n=1 Tax=Gilliamella mensalis TaxID=1908520 RepID=UPI000A14846A|nr:acyltransferase [Gilliamella mensalis]